MPETTKFHQAGNEVTQIQPSPGGVVEAPDRHTDFVIHGSPADVAGYAREGNDLVPHMRAGSTIRIKGIFAHGDFCDSLCGGGAQSGQVVKSAHCPAARRSHETTTLAFFPNGRGRPNEAEEGAGALETEAQVMLRRKPSLPQPLFRAGRGCRKVPGEGEGCLDTKVQVMLRPSLPPRYLRCFAGFGFFTPLPLRQGKGDGRLHRHKQWSPTFSQRDREQRQNLQQQRRRAGAEGPTASLLHCHPTTPIPALLQRGGHSSHGR
jgi:hypothetical protein